MEYITLFAESGDRVTSLTVGIHYHEEYNIQDIMAQFPEAKFYLEHDAETYSKIIGQNLQYKNGELVAPPPPPEPTEEEIAEKEDAELENISEGLQSMSNEELTEIVTDLSIQLQALQKSKGDA